MATGTLPLNSGTDAESKQMHGPTPSSLVAPAFALNAFKRGDLVSFLDNQDTNKQDSGASRHTPRIANKIKGIQHGAITDKKKEWWVARDSNPRPSACKADALTG